MQDCFVDTTLAVTHIKKWERVQARKNKNNTKLT